MRIAYRFWLVAFVFAVFILVGCNRGGSDIVVPDGSFIRGAYVLNQGLAGGNDASLSFLSTDGRVQQSDIYTTLVGRPLGDNPRSMEVHNGVAYIMMSGSNRIEGFNANTMGNPFTITGLNNPRYMAAIQNKAFVTEWTDVNGNMRGNVAVLNLATGTISKRITVGRGPERILLYSNMAYVTSTATANETYVYVLNTDTDQLVDSIAVAANPTSAAIDANNLLWVACAGNYNSMTTSYTQQGRILRINGNTKVVQQTHLFSTGSVPTQLVASHNNASMYFMMDNAVWRFDVAVSLPAKIVNRSFTTIHYFPRLRLLYAARSFGGNTPGRVYRYRFTDNGIQDSITVGNAPVGFAFNYAE